MSRKFGLLLVDSTGRMYRRICEILRESPREAVVTHVPDIQGMEAALNDAEGRAGIDLVLCNDDRPPEMVRESLDLLTARLDDVPLLVLSDSDDVQTAVDMIRAGARDWIISHHLEQRLIPAIERVLRDDEERRDSRQHYHELAEALPQGMYELDRQGCFTYVNQRGLELFGYTREDLRRHPRASELIAEKDRERAMKRVGEILAGDLETRAAEYEIIAGDGTLVPALIHSGPIMQGGEVVGVRGVVTDLREAQTVRRRLQESEERYRRLVETMADGLITIERDGTITYANQALAEMFEMPVEEALGTDIRDLMDEENRQILTHQIERRFTEGVRGSYQLEVILRSGRRLTVLINATPLRNDAGEVVTSLGVVTDITERREREERRRLGRARLSLINRLNEMLNVGDSIDEIIAAGADGIRDILHAHHVHISMRRSGDEVVMRHSNMPREIEERVFGAGIHGRSLLIPLRPGSQLRKLYERGELMEARGEDLTRTMNDLVQSADPSPVVSGMTMAQKLRIKYLCMMPLTRGEETMGHVTVSRAEDVPLNGAERAVLKGFAQQMAVVLDRARAEEEVARLNQFLGGIIENAAVWFSVIDEHGELIIWNRAAEEITGYSRDQIRSTRHLMTLLYPDEGRRAEAYEHLAAAFRGEWHEELETYITVADGSERLIGWHLRTFVGTEGGTGLVMIGRDVTESRELQEQLQRVQRMDAVGTLAGGIAHDFNNVLAAIVGHANLLAAEAERGSPVRWHAGEISANVERASRLTRQLLAFSRKQPWKPRVVDPARLVSKMEEMFRRVIPAHTELRLDVNGDTGYIEIDPSHLEQIVMNLVLNASDAMPDGGQLRVTTTNATLDDESFTELFDAGPGEYVSLDVADTGVGMDEETESHIFEPFFSTKERNGGTGLGLSTVYGLVRQNRGAIAVHSEVGEGTLFRVYLPRVKGANVEEQKAENGERAALSGDETLLVVEDADNLRDLIATILNSFGYTVITAAGGDEALQREAEHRGEIDLVISDVVMPEMSGTELAEKLLEISPELKVLFISGYPTEEAINAEHTDARYSFLQKPFSAVALGRRIREMLK
ncbi:MAG: PAS domain S-box protein [Armatimonadota bacterium]